MVLAGQAQVQGYAVTRRVGAESGGYAQTDMMMRLGREWRREGGEEGKVGGGSG